VVGLKVELDRLEAPPEQTGLIGRTCGVWWFERTVSGQGCYKAGNSRQALAASEHFRPVFIQEVAAIRQMAYRFLPVPDPVQQYLLELYAASELGTSMDELDTL
jgi:hypothetical protein